MPTTIKVGMGRTFFQLTELIPYDLVDCIGIPSWNKPRGAITPIRQQSATQLEQQDVVSYQRGAPDMPTFTVQSRMRDIQNFLFNLNCESNVQALFGDCGDPGNYYGFKWGIGWVRCPPGDLTGEALTIIEGDSVPVAMSNVFSAIYGPYLMDFTVGFLSRNTMQETGGIMDITMFNEECLSTCLFAAGNGQYGYAVGYAQAGSPIDASNVWFTEDYAATWGLVSSNPFGAGIDISAVVKTGTVNNHRVIVAQGEAEAGHGARIAYADVTVIGQTTWVTVNISLIANQYITAMAWPVYSKLFVVTNDGYIYRSEDGGVTWTQVWRNTAVGARFNDVSFERDGAGWACGNGDYLVKSEDFGSNWSVVTGPNLGARHLTTCCIDEELKLLVGDNLGSIYGTVNEGMDWVTLPAQGVVATNVVRIRTFATHFKWAIVDLVATAPAPKNSRVLRSTDGGASFKVWNLAINVVPNYGLNCIYPIDVNRVVVGGDPYMGTALVLRTDTTLDKIP